MFNCVSSTWPHLMRQPLRALDQPFLTEDPDPDPICGCAEPLAAGGGPPFFFLFHSAFGFLISLLLRICPFAMAIVLFWPEPPHRSAPDPRG